MSLNMKFVMLGVQDLAAARKFYVEGMGAEIVHDFPHYIALSLGEGSSTLALYRWETAAADAGVPSEGSGFRGVSLHCIAESREAVDEVIAAAEAAGGTVTKKAESAKWGGYFGFFADPDGYLWKVATAG